MAKTIFHMNEVANNANIIQVQLTKVFEEKEKVEEEVVENVDNVESPDEADLETVQKEIEELKAQWEEEKAKTLEEAQEEA